jgi:hypothetical protein
VAVKADRYTPPKVTYTALHIKHVAMTGMLHLKVFEGLLSPLQGLDTMALLGLYRQEVRPCNSYQGPKDQHTTWYLKHESRILSVSIDRSNGRRRRDGRHVARG